METPGGAGKGSDIDALGGEWTNLPPPPLVEALPTGDHLRLSAPINMTILVERKTLEMTPTYFL